MFTQRLWHQGCPLHPHIYFPVYSNGLKDIGRYLGFKRADESATGLQAIVWRKEWNKTKAPDIRAQLLQYNQDDCRALKHVFEFIGGLISSDVPTPPPGHEQRSVTNTADLRQAGSGSHKFRKIEFVVPDLDVVNRAAYFDYQRQKIFVRASTSLRRIFTKALPRRSRLKPNTVLQLKAKKCVSCGSRKISQLRPVKRTVFDLKFFKGGVKKWVTDYLSWKYKCAKVCGTLFAPRVFPGKSTKTWTRACDLVHIQQLGLRAEPA